MPKMNRKANYSLPESRFLVEKFKTHSAYFENNWTNGSRFEKTEVWQDIFDQYCEQFPHTDRTALDIRRKLIKLRSEAKMIIQREQLRSQGANIEELLSDRTLKLSVSPAHRMMMKAMRGEEDWAAENGDFVEYEVEFDDNQDDEEQKDDDNDVEYVEDDDEEGENDEDVNPENIIKKLFRPGDNPISMATAQRQSSTKNTSGSSEPTPKKRKHHQVQEPPSSTKTTPDEILCLQKQKLQMERKKLAIECDNLLLEQRKLQLEVMLMKQQVKQNKATSSSSTWNRKGRFKGAVFTRGPTKRSQKAHVDVVEGTIVESDSNGQENGQEQRQEVIQEETEAPEENGN